MISDAQKYLVLKLLLKGWNSVKGEFKAGFDDSSVARDAGVPVIEVRTIRWEVLGDTVREREIEARNRVAALKVVSDALIEKADAISKQAVYDSYVWADIKERLEQLVQPCDKILIGVENAKGTSVKIQQSAYCTLDSIWRHLDWQIEHRDMFLGELRHRGGAVGWSPPDAFSVEPA